MTDLAWQDIGLVFTTRSGRPVEPRNLVRSFRRICDQNKIRIIKVHHLRHTTASLLKKLRAPAAYRAGTAIPAAAGSVHGH